MRHELWHIVAHYVNVALGSGGQRTRQERPGRARGGARSRGQLCGGKDRSVAGREAAVRPVSAAATDSDPRGGRL